MAGPGRTPRPTRTLSVLETEWRSPHLIRVWAGGEGVEAFQDSTHTDRYIKIWFAKPELGLTPPFDMDELRERLAPEDMPVKRTYSVPVVTEDRVAIDFVVHGDEGVAGPWAARASAGDSITFTGPGGGYVPDASADTHVLAGDESAIPAIDAALTYMAQSIPDAVGDVYLQVEGAGDEIALTAPAGVRVHWLHRGAEPAGVSTALADAVRAHDFEGGRVQVFAHGERETMKAIRDALKPHGIPREDLSLSGYWAYGRTEDRFQAEKREPIGQIM